MASRKKINQKKGPASNKGRGATGKKRNVAAVLIVAVLVICGFEAINLFQGKTQKDIKVRQILRIVGEEKPCGHFTAWGIAPIGNDKIIIADTQNNRMLIFDRLGNLIKSWGKKGTGEKEFQEPSGVTADDKGQAYVMDTWNGSIKGFDENGKPVLNVDLTKFKNFYGPRGVAWDGRNFVVADTGNHRVVIVSPQDDLMASWGKHGTGSGEFQGPLQVAADKKGNYFVADTDNSRVQWLNGEGKVLKTLKYSGQVTAVAVDKEGRFYVASGADGGGVKAYSPKGDYLGDLKDENGSAENFRSPRWMNVTSDDVLMLTGGNAACLYQLPAVFP